MSEVVLHRVQLLHLFKPHPTPLTAAQPYSDAILLACLFFFISLICQHCTHTFRTIFCLHLQYRFLCDCEKMFRKDQRNRNQRFFTMTALYLGMLTLVISGAFPAQTPCNIIELLRLINKQVLLQCGLLLSLFSAT